MYVVWQQGQCQDSSNRLSYISLPGDRTSASLSSSPSLDQGGHLARTRRTRPSSTYEMLSGRPPPYQMPSAHQGTYDRFPTVRYKYLQLICYFPSGISLMNNHKTFLTDRSKIVVVAFMIRWLLVVWWSNSC